MKYKNIFTGLGLSSALWFNQGNAAIIQYQFEDNYKNPAALCDLQSFELVAGSRWVNPILHFKGTSSGGKGSAKSHVNDLLPFWFAGARAHERIAFGINFSNPFYGHVVYPEDSILRFDSTQTIVYDYDINPHVCLKLADKVSIGAGFVANSLYDTQLNLVVPTVGNVVNRYTGWSYGWDVGFCWKMTQRDTLEGAYFSQLDPNLRGTSSGGAFFSRSKAKGLHLPATSYLRYSRWIQPYKWFLDLKVVFSQWAATKVIKLTNIPFYGSLVFPLHYKNSWYAELVNVFKITDHWAIVNVLFVDENAAKLKSKTVNFPVCNIYGSIIGGNYFFTQATRATLKYTFAFGNCPIDKPLGMSSSVGKVHIWANVVEMRFDYVF
jgi:long-chain fatty acid transport protein